MSSPTTAGTRRPPDPEGATTGLRPGGSADGTTDRAAGGATPPVPDSPAGTTSPGRPSTTSLPAPAPGRGPEGDDAAAGPSTAGVLVWGVIAGTALLVGSLTVRVWPAAGLRAAPLYGHWDLQLGLAFVPPVVLGALAVGRAPALAARLAWNRLVATAGAGTVAWSVALAATEGWSRVSAPLANEHDYLAVVDRIAGPGDFLRTYTDRLAEYPTHVKGHPPGMPLLLWALDRVGLGGAGWATVVVLAGAGVATVATLVAARAVAGEAAARRAAPFVAMAPAALWLGTSADALFAGVGILGCACLIAGHRPAVHLAGGALLAVALHLTYGAVVLLAIPVVVAARRRDLRPLAWAVPGGAAVTAGFALGGFWWLDGLDATRHFYEIGIAAHRPYPVFTGILNPGVAALATGPAAAAGLGRLGWWARARLRSLGDGPPPGPASASSTAGAALAVLPLAALGAVALANLSGMSKGEVERIWLPFYPWLLTATAALPRRHVRAWLAAQVGLAVLLETSLRSAW